MTSPTVLSAIQSFLGNVEASQARHTFRSYRADLLGSTGFLPAMAKYIQPTMPINELQEEMAIQYFQDLLHRGVSTATFHRRASTLREFLRFVDARKWAPVSADRFKNLMKSGKLTLKPAPPHPFRELEPLIVRVFDYALNTPAQGEKIDRLIQLRDKAFVVTLADTGLRVHEACKLKRGDIDWTRMQTVIIGKGGVEGLVRFSPRSIQSIQTYLHARAAIDGASGSPLLSLPVFARHDDGGQKKVKPITPDTGEDIVHAMARTALGTDYDPRLTCHKFRHYFVTKILRKTDNLKIGQELARHKSITNTGRYAHVNQGELDRVHQDIFQ